MAIIGELAVNIVARTGALTRGLRRSRREVREFDKTLRRTTRGGIVPFFRSLRGIAGTAGLGGLGAGIGLIGVSSQFRSIAEEIDNLAKQSRKLGIATEAMAGLEIATQETGVDFSKLTTGLQRMTRRVAEAARGMGEARGAIRELGLSAQDLVTLAPDQAFERIAARIAEVPNQADRVRLAFKLLDSEGVDLVRTMELGARGFKEAREEAKRFGLALSETEVKRVENMNDEINRLSNSLRGLGRQIVVEVSQPISDAAEGLTELIQFVREARAREEGRQPRLPDVSPIGIGRNFRFFRRLGERLRPDFPTREGAPITGFEQRRTAIQGEEVFDIVEQLRRRGSLAREQEPVGRQMLRQLEQANELSRQQLAVQREMQQEPIRAQPIEDEARIP